MSEVTYQPLEVIENIRRDFVDGKKRIPKAILTSLLDGYALTWSALEIAADLYEVDPGYYLALARHLEGFE